MAVDRTTDPAADASGGSIVQWPAYFYGPDGQQEIFQSEEQVPDGWEDHPSKVAEGLQKNNEDSETLNDADYSTLSNDDIKSRLDNAGVSYQPAWPRGKLLSLLKKADATNVGEK